MERIWSEQQKEIFAWFAKDFQHFQDFPDIDARGHVVVRARAGTGKTTIIVEGVQRAPENKIIICAFSKIIQQELENRIGKNHPTIKAQTFHSIGLQCVKRFRENIKIDFSSTRADSLTEKVCGPRAPDAIKKLVSKLHCKGRELAPHATSMGELTDLAIQFECEPDEQWTMSGFPLEYVEQKALEAIELASQLQSGETIDGSDMIFLPLRNGWLVRLYNLVVVDETQDMTPAQLEMALGILIEGGRMCIVGDDRQAIFGWRGADSNGVDRLKDLLNAGELGLTVTYRCGKKIVELAQTFVPDIEAADNNPEGEIIFLDPSKLVETAGPADFILSRVNAPLVSIAMQLLKSGKRTRVLGKDIGKGLTALVRKFRATSVTDFLRKVESWNTREVARLTTQMEKAVNGRKKTLQSKIEETYDKAEMLTSLAEGAKNVIEIETRIVSLFEDDGLGAESLITCSSIHKAKGLESNRVFILEDTLRNYSKEEINLRYVAITRAKNVLVFVSDKL